MQVHLTQEQKDSFIKIIFHESVVHPGEMTPTHFYEKFMDFIDENEIEMEEEHRDEAEREMYHYCIDRGYIFVEQLCTISGEDIEKFIKKIKQSAPRVFFHIIRYEKDLADLSFSEIYNKTNGNTPGGWIASYCTCGTFYPISDDINSERLLPDSFYPDTISLEDIDHIIIRSDNVF